MQPEQGPLLAYHLEALGGTPKLRFASPIGAVKNDRVMDWTDGYDKLKDATPAKELDPCLLTCRAAVRCSSSTRSLHALTIGTRLGPRW